MTESDIYQLVGEAYCNGMVHGMEKSGSSKKDGKGFSFKDEAKFQAANAGSLAGSTLLSKAPMMAYARYGKDESALVDKLMQNAHKRGLIDNPSVRIGESLGKNNAAFILGEGMLDGKLKRVIEASPSLKGRAGVLAHEIGHAESLGKKVTDIYTKTKDTQKALSYGSRAGKLGAITGLATLVNTFGHNGMSDTAMNTVAGLGSAAMLPTVAEEAKASWNGYKLLRNAGKGRLGAALSFIGLPSYMALAATPFIPAALSKYMDKK